MASKRFEIDMALNASDVAKGAKDAEGALAELDAAVGKVGDGSSGAGSKVDDFADKLVAAARTAGKSDDDIRDSLRDMGYSADNAKKAVGQLGDDFKDAGRDGERSIDDLEDSLKDAQRETKDLGEDADKAGDDVRKGMKRAEDGVEEFRDEANSTAREAAASFDGSAESIADAFQEVAANALAGFGPAGAIAGLAAAAGIGLAVAGFEQFNEAEEASRERASEWADAYVEAGGRILEASQLVEKAREIITDPEQYAMAEKNAKAWGVSEATALLAMAGDTNALTEARDSLAAKEIEVSDALERTGGDIRGLNQDMRTMREEVSTGTSSLGALTGEMDAGAAQADVYSESLRLVAEHTDGATRKTDEFGDTVVTLPDGKQIYIDAETGKATSNVNAIEKKVYGIKDKDVNVNVITSGVGSAQGEIDRLVSRNNGRELRINARVVTSGIGLD